MLDWLQSFLAVRGLAPHGYCLLWEPRLIWTHVVADAAIAASYFSISILLWRLLQIRRDIAFGWMLGAFSLFILACGLTHVLAIITLWVPAYGWEAMVKLVTALASIATAVLLLKLFPRIISLPSPAQLQRANEALRIEAAERAKAEEMLRRSQKMEAIGQLAGGLAHDFNNLLGVVLGSIDRAQRKGLDTPAGKTAISNAVAAARRGAGLTQQLLAVSRQQPLQRRACDINEIARTTAELLDETIGPHIQISLDLDPDLPLCMVDRSQLEVAILNLGLNARDALEGGGRIAIETRLHAPGLVELAVADNGSGMDAAIQERAMEPFFTTKEIGKGTGLGLSQVVGTVSQMGGRVTLESSLGIGTTVRIFLTTQETSREIDDLPGGR